MPTIIPYSKVLPHLQELGMKSLYFNSGAFGFADGETTISRGWIGPADSSITAAGRLIACQAVAPFETTLAKLFVAFWEQSAAGSLWIMPKSHWAYELQFGSGEWLLDVLSKVGIAPGPMMQLNNAAALEFEATEVKNVEFLVEKLLKNLVGSDFQAVFLNGGTICTIHSRAQLWWTTVDARVVTWLDQQLPLNAYTDTAQAE